MISQNRQYNLNEILNRLINKLTANFKFDDSQLSYTIDYEIGELSINFYKFEIKVKSTKSHEIMTLYYDSNQIIFWNVNRLIIPSCVNEIYHSICGKLLNENQNDIKIKYSKYKRVSKQCTNPIEELICAHIDKQMNIEYLYKLINSPKFKLYSDLDKLSVYEEMNDLNVELNNLNESLDKINPSHLSNYNIDVMSYLSCESSIENDFMIYIIQRCFENNKKIKILGRTNSYPQVKSYRINY